MYIRLAKGKEQLTKSGLYALTDRASGNSVSRLELITRDELTHMAKPGKHLASQLSGTKDGLGWSVDAYLVVEGQTVTAVELGVKTMSSPTAVVKVSDIMSKIAVRTSI